MPWKMVVLGLTCLGFGVGAGWVMSRASDNGSYHWRVVDQHVKHVEDRSQYVWDSDASAYSTELPADPVPHLNALAAVGQLEHVDLVLSDVPNTRSTRRYWMQFVNESDGIVYASGNPSYIAFDTSNDSIHINLWFRPGGEAVVQQLIGELRALARVESD